MTDQTPNTSTVDRPPAKCADCGLAYGTKGFHDLIVPDCVWRKISPTGDEGGLLCPTCLVGRCDALGIQSQATFTSGPFTSIPPWRNTTPDTSTVDKAHLADATDARREAFTVEEIGTAIMEAMDDVPLTQEILNTLTSKRNAAIRALSDTEGTK